MSCLASVRMSALVAMLAVGGTALPAVAGDYGYDAACGSCGCQAAPATVVQHIYRQRHWFGHCVRPPAGIVVPSAPVTPVAPGLTYAPMPVAAPTYVAPVAAPMAAPIYQAPLAMAPVAPLQMAAVSAPPAAAPMPQLTLMSPPQAQFALVPIRPEEAALRAPQKCQTEEWARTIARALGNGCGQDGPGGAPAASLEAATIDDLAARVSRLEEQVFVVQKACVALNERLHALEATK